MKIYLLYDYDDRLIRASCDSKKITEESDIMNGFDENGEVLFGPYFTTSIELEDTDLLKEK